jgi:endonuclease I
MKPAPEAVLPLQALLRRMASFCFPGPNRKEDIISRSSLYPLVALLFAGFLSAGPPAGYYDPAAGLTGSELQQALHDIIDDHDYISYDDIWTAFFSTDALPDGIHVWDMYSDVPGGTPPYLYVLGDDQGGSAGGEGQGYNREHSWPKSWFDDGAPMNTDLFHIVPTDIYVNNRRGNYPYGEVSSPTWTSLNGSRLGPCCYPGYSGTVFEPIDAYKGDFARNYFYMATRYLGEDAGWTGSPMVNGAVLLPWAEAMLIEWHLADPVSDKETDRNDAVYAIQDNRNPYIDHPEFVLLVYDPTGIPNAGTQLETTMMSTPNPFETSTEIQFSLMENSIVSIGIFDLSGRRIASLTDDEQMSVGFQSVCWDGMDPSGRSAPSGIYFCVISVNDRISNLSILKIR